VSPDQQHRRYIGAAVRALGAKRTERANAEMAFVIATTHMTQAMVANFDSSVQARHGVTWPGFRLMFMLGVIGSATPSDLASRLGISRPSVTSVVSTLQNSSLLVREESETDRRSFKLSLSTEGNSLLDEMLDDQSQREHEWTAHLSLVELSTMTDLAVRILEQHEGSSTGENTRDRISVRQAR
jgi:DNA-binding MarR family transcriptional regulator